MAIEDELAQLRTHVEQLNRHFTQRLDEVTAQLGELRAGPPAGPAVDPPALELSVADRLQRQITQLGDQLRAQAELARGPEGRQGKQGLPGRPGRDGVDGKAADTVIREVKISG